MNFVFLSLQRINTDRESTSTSLAKELAKNHQILYVNPAIDRKTSFSKNADSFTKDHIAAIKFGKPALTKASENMWVLNPECILESINWIPSTKIFSVFNKVNNRRLAKEIKKALSELNFDSFILINDKDIFRSFYLKELLKPKLYIYLDRDYTIGFGYWKRHGVTLEPKLMEKSDAIICNSLDFTRNASLHNANSFYIGNGVDLALFNDKIALQIPEKFKNIPYPIIGYVGAILSSRLDISLIINTAKARPQWSIVLIGGEDDDFIQSELHQLPNVYFLGKIHKENIPPYMKYFNVCTNPQILNEITIGNFPLKIIEYLALGRPVVAISTNTMKEVFSEFTYLAETPNEYIQKIEQALLEDNPEIQQKRVRFAETFSWANIAATVIEIIEKLQPEKGSRVS